MLSLVIHDTPGGKKDTEVEITMCHEKKEQKTNLVPPFSCMSLRWKIQFFEPYVLPPTPSLYVEVCMYVHEELVDGASLSSQFVPGRTSKYWDYW